VDANWFAAEDVHGSYYGTPLRLASDARRLDTSPAWHNWVGTAATLAVVEELGVERIHAHDLALANRFRAGLGLAPSDSPVVVAEAAGAERLERAGIVAAVRAGRLRASWHAYNSAAEVDAVLDVLGG
jgi:selenocysteine lyase/cysteine desulfurase